MTAALAVLPAFEEWQLLVEQELQQRYGYDCWDLGLSPHAWQLWFALGLSPYTTANVAYQASLPF